MRGVVDIRWIALRGLEGDFSSCPRYIESDAVAGLYNFSLSKHHTLLGISFMYVATLGKSREAINLGLVYFAAAMSLDSWPIYTWLSGAVASGLPPIGRAGLGFIVISMVGIVFNSRHQEWRSS